MIKVLWSSLILIAILLIVWFMKPSVVKPLNTVPLTIAVSTTPLSAPLFIADKLSLFEKNGVYIELLPTRGGNLCFDKLNRNEANLATSSESVVMFNSFNRNDFAIISSFVESANDLKLFSLTSSNITSAEDFKDKRIGVVKASASEFFLYSYMILTGNSQLNIERVYLNASELLPALINNEVDVISIWEPYGYQLVNDLEANVYQFDTRGTYTLSFNLIANKTELQKYQIEHANLLVALSEAIDFINAEPEQAKSIVASYLNMSIIELDAVWPDYIFKLSIDNSLLLNLKTQAYWALDSGMSDHAEIPDFRTLIDPSAFKIATQQLAEK